MKVLQYSHLLYLPILNRFPDDNSVIFFINSFTIKYKKKKINRPKKPSVAICERAYVRLLFLFKYCVHVEIIPGNTGPRQVQEGFFYV